jgi:hypothetical protein
MMMSGREDERELGRLAVVTSECRAIVIGDWRVICRGVVMLSTRAWDNEIIVQQVLPMDQEFWRHLFLALVPVQSVTIDERTIGNHHVRASEQH